MNVISQMSNVKCQKSNFYCQYQMPNVNKVKLLSEHTSGAPPVIFFGETGALLEFAFLNLESLCKHKYFMDDLQTIQTGPWQLETFQVD